MPRDRRVPVGNGVGSSLLASGFQHSWFPTTQAEGLLARAKFTFFPFSAPRRWENQELSSGPWPQGPRLRAGE